MAQVDNNRSREKKIGDSRAKVEHKAPTVEEHSGKTEEEEQPGYAYKEKESTQKSWGRSFFQGFQEPGGFPQPGQPISGQPMRGRPPGGGGGVMGSSGLGFLSATDHLFVIQQIQLIEVLTGFELNNKYYIRNDAGDNLFYAIEDTHWVKRNVLSSSRPFDMKIFDSYGTEVIHLYRPFAGDNCGCCWCLQKMDVFLPPGELVGSIKQKWSMCIAKFAVMDAYGETVFRIVGPCCAVTDVNFKVMSVDGSSEIGMVTRHWAGLARDFVTNANIFGISFPRELDVRMKAVLLGACFLIDFMYFEEQNVGMYS